MQMWFQIVSQAIKINLHSKIRGIQLIQSNKKPTIMILKILCSF